MGYPATINKNIYTLFEKNNPEIALTVLHVDVHFEIFKSECQECARVYKSIKQSYVSKHCFKREKKGILLLIPDNISVKEELSKKRV